MLRSLVLVVLAVGMGRVRASEQFTYFEDDNLAVESRQETTNLGFADFNSDYSHFLPQAGFGERIGEVNDGEEQDNARLEEDRSEDRGLKLTSDFFSGFLSGKNDHRDGYVDDLLNTNFLSDILSGSQDKDEDVLSELLSGGKEVDDVQDELSALLFGDTNTKLQDNMYS